MISETLPVISGVVSVVDSELTVTGPSGSDALTSDRYWFSSSNGESLLPLMLSPLLGLKDEPTRLITIFVGFWLPEATSTPNMSYALFPEPIVMLVFAAGINPKAKLVFPLLTFQTIAPSISTS